MPLRKASKLHSLQTHLHQKMSCNMTRDQLILVSWSLIDTWKRLLLNIIISLRSLKKNSTSIFFIFLRHLTSTFKILWYLWRKNKMFKALWFIFPIRRWISYIHLCTQLYQGSLALDFQWHIWKKLWFFITWPWWTPLFLHCPRKLYILLSAEGDWYPNPSVHIENMIPW